MRRVVVTGGETPLGRRVLEILRAQSWVEHAGGVGSIPDHRRLVDHLEEHRIDTVIQCGLVPDRCGRETKTHRVEVIPTMCIGAAIGHEPSRVRSWVVASSTAIYPIGSHSPLFQREQDSSLFPSEVVLAGEGTALAASIGEAESYARNVAHQRPHVNIAILRLQQIVGPGVRGPLAALLARDLVPSPLGFDPAIQLLHLEDAASAIAFAAQTELAGIYNLASRGIIRWTDAVRETQHRAISVLPINLRFAEPILKRLGIPWPPAELMELLRFGHAVDIEKIERSGWRPRHDQKACLAPLRSD